MVYSMKSPIMISIVDDNKNDYIFLKTEIEKWADCNDTLTEIHYFVSGTDFITALSEKNLPCNVVFLDIIMPEKDGMQIAEVMNKDYPDIYKVLYSSTIEFLSKGYIVNAVRYLIKNAKDIDENIVECMDYIKKRIYEDTSAYYDLSTAKIKIPPIPCNQIVSVSVAGNYVLIHTIDGSKHKQRKSLKAMENELPEHFIHCNRKTLVNIRQIKQIADQRVIMKDKSEFQISSLSAGKFLESLSKLS